MNRREFLRSVGLLATLPMAFPTVSEGQQASPDLLAIIRAAQVSPDGSDYFAFIHPCTMKSIREYEVRGAWEFAWRRYRVTRAEGLCGYLEPRAVWERFNQYEDPFKIAVSGEIGRFEGVRIIETAEVGQ